MHSPIAPFVISTALLLIAQTSQGHLSYTGRNFGIFTGVDSQTATITGQTVPNNWGWADGTDADFGHSHQMRFFRFTLENAATVTITATSLDATAMLPAFSIYAGLAHASPLDYENAAVFEYLATLPGSKKEGAFNALATWRMGNDNSVTYDDFSTFTYVGHAVDGTAANFGAAAGILGDGIADGTVSSSFDLPAGSYTLAVGGAVYAGQGSGAPTSDGANEGADLVPDGVTVSLAVVPEPGVAAMIILAGSFSSGMVRARRRSAR